jgi:hypothetical protein
MMTHTYILSPYVFVLYAHVVAHTVMSLRVIPRRQRPSFGKKLYLLRHIYCGIFAT